MGAWFFVRPRLEAALEAKGRFLIKYVGKPVAAAAATGAKCSLDLGRLTCRWSNFQGLSLVSPPPATHPSLPSWNLFFLGDRLRFLIHKT